MNRRLALILSLVYCGLGQIYKREAGKGISFAIIYTSLGLSLIFMAANSPLAQLLLICLLIFMWLTGMIDAYANDETFIESNHGLLLKTFIMVLIVIGIVGSVVTMTILFVQPQIFAIDSNSNKMIGSSQPKSIVTNKSDSVLQEAQSQLHKSQTNETIQKKPTQASNYASSMSSEEAKKNAKSENPGYYTIQVGAFSESNRAEELSKQLREKGYSVSVISPLPDESPAFYKVQVGKYDNKDSAAKSAEKLNKYKGVTEVTVLNISSRR